MKWSLLIVFDIVDVSEWESLEHVVTLGRRSKDWLIHPLTREHALFKRPNYHPTESTAEKAAAEIGPLVGVPTARTELAVRNGQYGVLSFRFLEKDETLQDGGNVIIARYPEYDRLRGKQHSFQILEEILPAGLLDDMIDLIAFDALIGNTDRHQDNWSLIQSPALGVRLAPSYDHGTLSAVTSGKKGSIATWSGMISSGMSGREGPVWDGVRGA